MSKVDGYKITNTEGRDGRAWRGMYDTKISAAHGICVQMGWENYVCSEPFADVDDEGRGIRCWSVYETQAECDEARGVGMDRAPRIVEVLCITRGAS